MNTPYINNWHPHVTGFPQTPQTGIISQFRDQPYRVVVNVSDDPMWDNAEWYRENGIEYHWIPMGDCTPLGLQSIYAAMMVMYRAEHRGKKLLLHCAAGVNRSQTVLDCYHYMRFGTHRIWTWMKLVETKVNWNGEGPREIHWMNMLECNTSKPDGRGLPSMPWMEKWLTDLREQLSTQRGIQPGTFDSAYLAAQEA